MHSATQSQARQEANGLIAAQADCNQFPIIVAIIVGSLAFSLPNATTVEK
jgi:hypothetical protein